MLRVEVADVTADWAVVGAAPALAGRLPGRHGAPRVWVDPWPALGPGQRFVRRRVDEAAHPGRERRVRRGARAARASSPRRCGGRARWPAPGRPRRCGSRRGGRGSGSRPTTGRSRTRSTGCARPSTCRRGATAGRRRSPGCTTWAGRRGGWCSCTWTARSTRCRRTATRCSHGDRQVGFVTTAARHHELGPDRAGAGQALDAGRRRADSPAASPRAAGGRRRALTRLARPGARRVRVRRPYADGRVAGTLITVAPTGRRAPQGRRPAAADDARRARRRGEGLRGRRRGADPRAHPGRRAPAHARPRPAARHRRGAARADRPRRAALDRRQRARPAGRAGCASSTPRPTRAR